MAPRLYTRLVSIHARLATGDISHKPTVLFHVVSIHARLATGDDEAYMRRRGKKFQFTPVLRRATRPLIRYKPREVSIHARLATGDKKRGEVMVRIKVSIHARLATGD